MQTADVAILRSSVVNRVANCGNIRMEVSLKLTLICIGEIDIGGNTQIRIKLVSMESSSFFSSSFNTVQRIKW